MDRQEAIDNLRVAVKATLMTVNFQAYRIWAHKYLEQSEPRIEGLEELKEMADERIEALADMQPWLTCGRARECWFIVETIYDALGSFTQEEYRGALIYAMDAVGYCKAVLDRSLAETCCFAKSLKESYCIDRNYLKGWRARCKA